MRSGKGAAYARWAKVYNLKQMAAALQFMQEQNITEYDQLSSKAEDAVSRFHALTEKLRQTEADLSATSELMGAVVQYHVKQILLSSFANNTAKNSSGDILANPPEQRDNNSGGSPYVP